MSIPTKPHKLTDSSPDVGLIAPPKEGVRAAAEATTVRQRVLDALQRIAPNVALGALSPDAPLRDQVDLDSMDWLNFIAALERAFGIDIREADYAQLATLDDIDVYLRQRHPVRSERRAPTTQKYRLVDGRTVTIRPIGADDAQRVRNFLEASSDESRYRRFQQWIRAPSNALVHFLTDSDARRGVALVASVPTESDEEIIAEARCVASADGKSCDLGLLVEDAWQKTGVAGLLVEALIEALRGAGVATIEGSVLADNAPMLQFARALGFEIEPMEGDRSTLQIRLCLQPGLK